LTLIDECGTVIGSMNFDAIEEVSTVDPEDCCDEGCC